MNSYQVIEFLDALPKKGVIEIDRRDSGEFYVIASTASYEAMGEDAIKITAELGYGTLSTVPSVVLLPCEEITLIRHTRGSHE